MTGNIDMTSSDRHASCAGSRDLVADGKDASPKEWAVMINRHPTVVRQVLQVINSSYGHLPMPIASVQQAVVYLGFNTVRNLADDLSLTCVA